MTGKIFRGAMVVLMLGVAPMASAVGQEMQTAPQTLIQRVADGQAVGRPASMAAATVAAAELTVDAGVSEARAIAAARAEMAAIEAEAAALDPGEFLWRPERAATGPVEIVVSLAEQRAYVYRANTLIGVTTVSTGRRGNRTPTGSFTILQKNRRHFSNLYNNAPMPNMQRLTWDGIALHAGALPGYAASHGCVRLPTAFSRILFGVTSLGGRVHIVAHAPPSAHEALRFAAGGDTSPWWRAAA